MTKGHLPEDLREDKVLNALRGGTRWVQDHATLAAAAVVGLVVLAIAVNAVSHRSGGHDKEMEETYARASIDFARGSFQTAALTLENFLARYPGSAWAGEAALRAAAAQLFLGNTADARDLYERYLADYAGDPFLDRAARHGLAACAEQSANFVEAAAQYEELAGQAESAAETAYHLEAAARACELAGNFAKAIEILEKIQSQDTAGASSTVPLHLLELRARAHLRDHKSAPFTS